MPDVRITWTTNLPQVIARVRLWPEQFQREVSAVGEELRSLGAARLKAGAPVRTGALRDALDGRVVTVGRDVDVQFTVEDHMRQRYRWVTYGTAPHEIRATRSALRWIGRGGGPVYRPSVRHPGARPNPFAERELSRLEAGPYWERAATRFASWADAE
jgi:hypothetical protein